MEQFETILQSIVAAMTEDATKQREIEAMLVDLDTKGWHPNESVQQIWRGERIVVSLMEKLDALETALIRRLLEIIAGE